MLAPEQALKVHERLEVGIIHPIEHTILTPDVGLARGSFLNHELKMTEPKAGYDAQVIDWNPIIKQMIMDLEKGEAWWRQDSVGQVKGSEDDGRDWWMRHGCQHYDRR